MRGRRRERKVEEGTGEEDKGERRERRGTRWKREKTE